MIGWNKATFDIAWKLGGLLLTVILFAAALSGDVRALTQRVLTNERAIIDINKKLDGVAKDTAWTRGAIEQKWGKE